MSTEKLVAYLISFLMGGRNTSCYGDPSRIFLVLLFLHQLEMSLFCKLFIPVLYLL